MPDAARNIPRKTSNVCVSFLNKCNIQLLVETITNRGWCVAGLLSLCHHQRTAWREHIPINVNYELTVLPFCSLLFLEYASCGKHFYGTMNPRHPRHPGTFTATSTHMNWIHSANSIISCSFITQLKHIFSKECKLNIL